VRDVFFLTSGQFRAPGFALAAPDARAPRGVRAALARTLMSNTVAVCVRENGDLLLVDCGWSAEVIDDPVRSLGLRQTLGLGLDARPGEALSSQLRALGVPLAKVRTVVATHLHLDHVGGIGDFPDAELVTVDRELTAFRTSGPRAGYRVEDLARTGRIRVASLAQGPTYGFPASADLFDDGTVVLLDARGHTRGNLAVALRTRTGTWVHVGDTVYQTWEYGLSPAGPCRLARLTAWSAREQRASYAALRACEADPRRPVIVPSHDAAVFERLPHRPAPPAS